MVNLIFSLELVFLILFVSTRVMENTGTLVKYSIKELDKDRSTSRYGIIRLVKDQYYLFSFYDWRSHLLMMDSNDNYFISLKS